jgi:flagellin|tara:strand:+ start:203 stop:1033 length:831 start_codon:yes stop_codon:yes gene_type:complete
VVINSNNVAEKTASNLSVSTSQLSSSLNRLSTGSKLSKPSDDAAGLAVTSRFESQFRRLNSSFENIANAMSFTQTQDGYLKTINTALTRMGELSLLAQDATLSNTDRNLYDKEFQQLKDFMARAKAKQFNGVDLFSSNNIEVSIDSSRSAFVIPPVDLNSESFSFVDANADDEDSEPANLKTLRKAKESLAFVSKAVSEVALARAQIGAIQSRLVFTDAQLTSTKENLSNAMSRINDVNVAEEATQYARYQILVQSGTSMLSQANAMPKTVLQLLA